MTRRSVKKLFSCLPILFFMTFNLAPKPSQAMLCSELLLPKPNLVSSFFINPPKAKLDKVYNDHMDGLIESQPFLNFMREQKIDLKNLIDFKMKTLIVEKYLDAQLRKYFNLDFLESERTRVMNSILKIRGHNMKYQNPYLVLKDQSYQNLIRLVDSLPKLSPIKNPAVQERIEQVVQNINVNLVHNTHHLYKTPEYPIVAPKVLEEIGLGHFGISTLPLHKTIQSDQQVYFFAVIEKSGQLKENGYESNAVMLKSDYAAQEAWISPFVMHSKPAEMHRWDFTVTDFQTLIRITVRNELERLYATNAYMYSVTVRKIEKMKLSELNKFVLELIKERFRFQGSFEGRVPVAVPPNQLEQI